MQNKFNHVTKYLLACKINLITWRKTLLAWQNFLPQIMKTLTTWLLFRYLGTLHPNPLAEPQSAFLYSMWIFKTSTVRLCTHARVQGHLSIDESLPAPPTGLVGPCSLRSPPTLRHQWPLILHHRAPQHQCPRLQPHRCHSPLLMARSLADGAELLPFYKDSEIIDHPPLLISLTNTSRYVVCSLYHPLIRMSWVPTFVYWNSDSRFEPLQFSCIQFSTHSKVMLAACRASTLTSQVAKRAVRVASQRQVAHVAKMYLLGPSSQ